INRADRQYWRKDMVAEKMEDASGIQADVVLHYGYEEPEPIGASIREGHPANSWRQEYYNRDEIPPSGGRTLEIPIEAKVEEGSPVSSFAPIEEEEPQRPVQKTIQEVAVEDPKSQKLSPIAQKALKGYVG
ncbi:hypothetical protein LCGC14_2545860, partial [marine sediment metagenome]